jgi:hypothetical protein
MDKVVYWLKKLGILRAGVFTAKGDAKKIVDMEIKGELYQSDKEIDKEMVKKEKSKKRRKQCCFQKRKKYSWKNNFLDFSFDRIFLFIGFLGFGLVFLDNHRAFDVGSFFEMDLGSHNFRFFGFGKNIFFRSSCNSAVFDFYHSC